MLRSAWWSVFFVVALAACGEAPADPPRDAAPGCEPACRPGFACSRGMCVSACNPPCGAGETCTADLRCVAMSVDAGMDATPDDVAPPDSPPLDTGAMPPLDTGAVPPLDTGTVPPSDTGVAPVDTGVAPPLDTGVDASCGALTRCGGACVDTRSDPLHCGACGNVCDTTNGRASCSGGACSIACSAGFGDCDANAANGCETNLTTTPAHCGRCGNACTAGRVCSAGACGTTCASPTTLCGAACVDLATDNTHCGMCGRTCPRAQNASGVCRTGACTLRCHTGYGDCDGVGGCEVDLSVSVAHCGACGRACVPPANATATCAAGSCGFVCNAGFMPSGGGCVVMPGAMAPAPRPLAPLSTATVTSRRPTLRWALPAGVEGAHVDLCRDRAMTTGCVGLDATGNRVTPTTDLAPGLWYWRLRGVLSGVRGTATSPVWQFNVGARTAGVLGISVDVSWGTYPDVNGDGHADVLVGAPGASATTVGSVHVYHGGPGGLPESATLTLRGTMGDQFGYSVASAGDVNGDGFADAVVGAPGTGAAASAAYVFFGSATGLPSAPSATLMGTAGAQYAYSVSSAGDVNGDGYADIVVGEAGTERARGNAYVYFGGRSGPGPSPSQTITGIGFGQFIDVAAAGDVNADGFGDVVMSNYVGGYLHLGSAAGLATTAAASVATGGDAPTFADSAGDVNGDGLADVLVGSSRVGSTGTIYVLHGRTIGAWGRPETALTGGAVATMFLGLSLAGLGDVNGDGYGDIIGAGNTAIVYYGSPAGLNDMSGARTYITLGYSGRNLAGAGDVNRDGNSDLLISFGSYGRVQFHVSLGTAGISATPSAVLMGSRTDYFGLSVAALDGWRLPVVVLAPLRVHPSWLGS